MFRPRRRLLLDNMTLPVVSLSTAHPDRLKCTPGKELTRDEGSGFILQGRRTPDNIAVVQVKSASE